MCIVVDLEVAKLVNTVQWLLKLRMLIAYRLVKLCTNRNVLEIMNFDVIRDCYNNNLPNLRNNEPPTRCFKIFAHQKIKIFQLSQGNK